MKIEQIRHEIISSGNNKPNTASINLRSLFPITIEFQETERSIAQSTITYHGGK